MKETQLFCSFYSVKYLIISGKAVFTPQHSKHVPAPSWSSKTSPSDGTFALLKFEVSSWTISSKGPRTHKKSFMFSYSTRIPVPLRSSGLYQSDLCILFIFPTRLWVTWRQFYVWPIFVFQHLERSLAYSMCSMHIELMNSQMNKYAIEIFIIKSYFIMKWNKSLFKGSLWKIFMYNAKYPHCLS